jgi:hypothetical protein
MNILEKIKLKDFAKLSTKKKKDLIQNNMDEYHKLNPPQSVKIQSIQEPKKIHTFNFYENDPIALLRYKIKAKKEYDDLIIWNGNNIFDDTDTLEDPRINFNLPFRFLTEEESETAGQSKMVRDITEEDKVHAQVKKAQGDPVYLGGKKRRRKKKKKKAFPSRRKNNRKNRTKKKARK